MRMHGKEAFEQRNWLLKATCRGPERARCYCDSCGAKRSKNTENAIYCSRTSTVQGPCISQDSSSAEKLADGRKKLERKRYQEGSELYRAGSL